jgi:hypothetical protein
MGIKGCSSDRIFPYLKAYIFYINNTGEQLNQSYGDVAIDSHNQFPKKRSTAAEHPPSCKNPVNILEGDR